MAIRSVVEVRGNDLYSGGKIRIYNRDKNHRGVIITIQEDDMKSPHKALCLSVGECMTLVEIYTGGFEGGYDPRGVGVIPL